MLLLLQVFKFSPLGSSTKRLLALGDKLVPGSGNSRFCKPTSVAVDRSGEFFVADGYVRSENAVFHVFLIEGCPRLTAPFNNMRTLKFKVQPTNAFFAAVNQMFGGSSQLLTTTEHCFVAWTVLNDLITARSTVAGNLEESLNTWLTVAKNTFVSWAYPVRVRMLLKGVVKPQLLRLQLMCHLPASSSPSPVFTVQMELELLW